MYYEAGKEDEWIGFKLEVPVELTKLWIEIIKIFMQGFYKLTENPVEKLKHVSSYLVVIAFITKPTYDEKFLILVPSVKLFVFPAK